MPHISSCKSSSRTLFSTRSPFSVSPSLFSDYFPIFSFVCLIIVNSHPYNTPSFLAKFPLSYLQFAPRFLPLSCTLRPLHSSFLLHNFIFLLIPYSHNIHLFLLNFFLRLICNLLPVFYLSHPTFRPFPVFFV